MNAETEALARMYAKKAVEDFRARFIAAIKEQTKGLHPAASDLQTARHFALMGIAEILEKL